MESNQTYSTKRRGPGNLARRAAWFLAGLVIVALLGLTLNLNEQREALRSQLAEVGAPTDSGTQPTLPVVEQSGAFAISPSDEIRGNLTFLLVRSPNFAQSLVWIVLALDGAKSGSEYQLITRRCDGDVATDEVNLGSPRSDEKGRIRLVQPNQALDPSGEYWTFLEGPDGVQLGGIRGEFFGEAREVETKPNDCI